MPSAFSLLVAIALAELLGFALLSLRYGRSCSGSYQPRAMTAPVPEVAMSEIAFSNLEAESRGHRAMALMCASVCWRGDPTDTEGLLSVADEFLQYIQGDNSIMPRPDKAIKGSMPQPKKPYGL